MPAEDKAREYKMLEASVREYAARELLPRLAESDRYPAGAFFEAALAKAMELSYFHVMLPEEQNGWGGEITPLGIIVKAVAEVDAGMAAILLANAAAQEVLRQAGEHALLGELTAAEDWRDVLIAYPLMTSPEEDDIRLRARPEQGGYSLTGEADYVLLAPMAKKALLPARIGEGQEYAFFLVDLMQPGARTGEPVLSMGLHSCPAADLVLSGARGRLAGKADGGAGVFASAAARMLPAAAAAACGLMQGSLKEALRYARKRRQGGRRIIDWSELRLLLAGMALKAQAGRMLLDQAWRAADGEEARWNEAAYTAAIYNLDSACELAADGIQALGGYGYTKHHFQERRFRDAQHLRCAFGSANPRRLLFAEQSLGC